MATDFRLAIRLLVFVVGTVLAFDREIDCSWRPESGFCRGFFTKFYYDPVVKRCKQFSYSGCGGNDNNFRSEDDCLAACSGTLAESWRWRPQTGSVANSQAQTEQRLSEIGDPCLDGFQLGNCQNPTHTVVVRYFFNGARGCQPSVFCDDGRPPGKNNFETADECVDKCIISRAEALLVSSMTTVMTSRSTLRSTAASTSKTSSTSTSMTSIRSATTTMRPTTTTTTITTKPIPNLELSNTHQMTYIHLDDAKCNGVVVARLKKDSADECADACDNNEECGAFSFGSANMVTCLLIFNCIDIVDVVDGSTSNFDTWLRLDY